MKTKALLTSMLVGLGSLLLAQAGNAAPITIKFAHNSPPRADASFHHYFVIFEGLAKKYTNGKVEFQEFPASQMGSDQQAAKKLQLGLIQMMDLASNNLAQLYSGFDLFTLPFLIKSMDCGIKKVLPDQKLLHEISEGAQKKANIRVLAFETGGMRNMMNSKHPIMSPADLKGLRMRVAKNPILLDTYHALGADVIGVASAETYGALQTHMVDGNDGGAGWAYAQKLYEVQKYFSITGHQMVVTSVIINNKFYEGLPKDVQAGSRRAAPGSRRREHGLDEQLPEQDLRGLQEGGAEVRLSGPGAVPQGGAAGVEEIRRPRRRHAAHRLRAEPAEGVQVIGAAPSKFLARAASPGPSHPVDSCGRTSSLSAR